LLRCAIYNLTIASSLRRTTSIAGFRYSRHEQPRNVKFQPDSLDGVNTIARHEGTRVWIGNQPHEGSVIVPWSGPVRLWRPRQFDDLTADDFDELLPRQPEVVIFGSGVRLRFPQPPLVRGLFERRIGFETMDTAAACRTYNVLVGEGRNVVAALLLDSR